MSKAFDLFETGNLQEALKMGIETVRNSPADIDGRWELVTLLCFDGDLERAQKHIQVMLDQDHASDMYADLLMFNGLLKGETARRQCFENGRLPNFTESPSEEMQQYLRALTEFAEAPAACTKTLADINASAMPLAGVCDDQPFTKFTDAHSLTGFFLEAITMSGEYYWLPFRSLKYISLSDLDSPQDVIWRHARLTTIEHEEVTAFLPALYPGTSQTRDDALKLGRAVEFTSEPPLLGLGGRVFLIDGETKPMSSISEISFNH